MQKFLLFIILLIPGIFTPLYGQHDSLIAEYINECVEHIQQLTPSYTGKTREENFYELYAIHKKKEWILLVLDSTSFYSFTQKDGELEKNTIFFDNNLCKMVDADFLEEKTKKKKKDVGDFQVNTFYKFTKKGKRFYKSFLSVEHPHQNVGFIKKLLAGKKLGMLEKMEKINKQYEEMAAKMQEYDKIKKEKEALEKQLEALNDPEKLAKKQLEDAFKKEKPKEIIVVIRKDTSQTATEAEDSTITKTDSVSIPQDSTVTETDSTHIAEKEKHETVNSAQNNPDEQNTAAVSKTSEELMQEEKESLTESLNELIFIERDILEQASVAEGEPSSETSTPEPIKLHSEEERESIKKILENKKRELEKKRREIEANGGQLF